MNRTRHAGTTVVACLCLLLGACSRDANEPAAVPAPTQPAETASAAVETEPAIDNRGGDAADSGKWWSALPRPDWANYRQVATLNPWFEVYEILDGIYAI